MSNKDELKIKFFGKLLNQVSDLGTVFHRQESEGFIQNKYPPFPIYQRQEHGGQPQSEGGNIEDSTPRLSHGMEYLAVFDELDFRFDLVPFLLEGDFEFVGFFPKHCLQASRYNIRDCLVDILLDLGKYRLKDRIGLGGNILFGLYLLELLLFPFQGSLNGLVMQ